MADTSSTFPTLLDNFPTLVSKRATPQPIASEPFVIPTSSPYDYPLVEVPQEATLTLAGTPPGGGGTYTAQSGPPTASGEAQVNWKTGRVTFFSTDAGGSVIAAYTGLGSSLTVERILKAYNAALAIEQTIGAQYLPTGFATLKDYLQSELNILRAEATAPVSQTFRINGGVCFINRHTLTSYSTTVIDLVSAGTYQFPATTATYWRRALFTVTEAGVLNVYWSGEVAAQGSLADPVRPVNEFSICAVDCEDDGSGLAGTCEDINPADITDLRQQLNLTWDSEADAFYVQQSPVADDKAYLSGGTFFSRSAAGVVTQVVVSSAELDFGASGAQETAAITASHWNALVLTVTSAGVLTTYEGTSAAAKGSVVLPDIPKYGELPVMLLFFQDDGTGTAGTILPIVQANVINLYMPRLVVAGDTTSTPALTLDDIDDFRTRAQTTPDKTVYVEPGRFMGKVGDVAAYEWLGGSIDFGSAGTHQKTITGSYYLPVVLATDSSHSAIFSYDGGESASVLTSVSPRIPDRMIPLAQIVLQGDGTGTAGGVLVVADAAITDLRGPLRSWKWKWHQDGLSVRRSTVGDKMVVVEQGTAFFDSGSYYGLTTDVSFDIGGSLAYALNPSYYKWVLISMKSDGTMTMAEPLGGGGAAISSAPMPTLEFVGKNRPLAYVLIQDAGSGVLGDIVAIADTEIYPPYEWASRRFHTEDWFAVLGNTSYPITHDLDRLPRSIMVLWAASADDADINIVHVAGPVFLSTGMSVIEINSTTLKLRTDTYVVGYRDASGILQQPTAGYYKVIVQ